MIQDEVKKAIDEYWKEKLSSCSLPTAPSVADITDILRRNGIKAFRSTVHRQYASLKDLYDWANKQPWPKGFAERWKRFLEEEVKTNTEVEVSKN